MDMRWSNWHHSIICCRLGRNFIYCSLLLFPYKLPSRITVLASVVWHIQITVTKVPGSMDRGTLNVVHGTLFKGDFNTIGTKMYLLSRSRYGNVGTVPRSMWLHIYLQGSTESEVCMTYSCDNAQVELSIDLLSKLGYCLAIWSKRREPTDWVQPE